MWKEAPHTTNVFFHKNWTWIKKTLHLNTILQEIKEKEEHVKWHAKEAIS